MTWTSAHEITIEHTPGTYRSTSGPRHRARCVCGWQAKLWRADSRGPDGILAEASKDGDTHLHLAEWEGDHELGHENSIASDDSKYVRVTCPCGHEGPWRLRGAVTCDKNLYHDSMEHLQEVRKARA